MNILNHKLGQALQLQVKQGKRPCFRLNGLRITMASEASANPGALYIKDDNWDYIGKVTNDGFIKIRHPNKITTEQKMLVMSAIRNPEGVAMSNGKETGICCCCGRTLTNKLSIELGIGPICRGLWFPDSIATTELESLNLEEQSLTGCLDPIAELEAVKELDTLTDSLDLDLGTPYKTPETVKTAINHLASLPTPSTPVDNLVLSFRELDPDQKVSFITTIVLEAVNSNASN